MLSFAGVSVHFLYFYFNEKELNQQVCLCLPKYAENEISDSTFHRERKRERERERAKAYPTSKTCQIIVISYTSY